MVSVKQGRRGGRGFNMVELMVACVLAAIIFSAMVPLFANALKTTSSDGFSVTANNIAQERIEQTRLLAYSSISATPDNLNAPPAGFGDGLFGPNYQLPGSNKVYHIAYTVDDHPADSYKKVSVAVSWSDGNGNRSTSMSTMIMDPSYVTVSTTSGSPTSTPSPSSTTGFYKITVSFKNWADVKKSGSPKGVYVVRQDCTPKATAAPAVQYPSAGSPTVTWTGLPGGPSISYVVTCVSQYGTFSTPMFHLLSDCPIYFDTHP
jgi:type II secretory pathway pseudopilin PulG